MSFAERTIERATRRAPDFVIGSAARPYLLRWWLLPRNKLLNAYLHCFMRSDDDRALHDHPWANASLILRGSYVEHTIDAGGIHRRTRFDAGAWRVRWTGRVTHRIELFDGPCWTLFLTGPRYRKWGFHCPDAGWIPWERFTKQGKPGEVGPGCEG